MVKGQGKTMFTAQQGTLHKQEAMCCTNTHRPVMQYMILTPERLSITGIKQTNKNPTRKLLCHVKY
jgi:hypothetical protein